MAVTQIAVADPITGSVVSKQTNSDIGAVVTLTAAAVSGNSADQTNWTAKGGKFVVNVTAITGTGPSLTVAIQGKDGASGAYYTILQSAAISATGTTVLDVYPGTPNATNAAQGVALPKTWRILYTIAGTGPAVTATVGACLIP